MFSDQARGFWVRNLVLVGTLLLWCCGCASRTPQGVERLAIAPLEDLSDGGARAWVGVAISEIATVGVTGSPRTHPLRIGSPRDAALTGATTRLTGYYTIMGGRLRLTVSREDLARNRLTGTFTAEEQFPQGLFRISGSLARWLEPAAHGFDTKSLPALQAFAEGRMAEDPATAAAAFERAVAADRDFGGAYSAWAQTLLSRRDLAGFQMIIREAAARKTNLTDYRQAELEILTSAASGDAAGRRRALLAMSKVTPADADVFRQLATLDSASRQYPSAAEFYRRATALDPRNTANWNQLGYTEALHRNLRGARGALEEYLRLAPQDPNASDSLGDVNYYLGAFREAERHYLDAYRKDRAFAGGAELYKAARARLMTGDVSGAEEIFRRYSDDRTAAQDGAAALRGAQWAYLTGRQEAAVAGMRQVAVTAKGDLSSLAAAQLSAWNLTAGERQQGAAWSRKAAERAVSPAARAVAALCLSVSGAPVPQGILASDGEKRASAIVLLLAGRFGEAVEPLKDLAARVDPLGQERIEPLLAWALVETGRHAEAGSLLESYGVPPTGFEDLFAGLILPRVFKLRAAVLEGRGQRREAAELRSIYQRLGGR